MAVLDSTQRSEIFNRLMRDFASIAFGDCPLNKTDLKAAVDATDTWVDGAASNYNSALPTAARTNLSGQQKALLLVYVVLKRAGR